MPQDLTSLIETIANTALIVRPVAISATHTITIGTFISCDATGGAFTVTLPSAALNESRILIIFKKDSAANTVTVSRAGSDLINGATTYAGLTAQYNFVILINDEDGTNWNIIGSN